ncbi:glycerate dehydrogenase [Cordyceps fumosorosea ARSEF 2679]|uniref:Glycerate dehydrogenase n=1 Tax=Cordyceps fumosorosea (strain ARSEF 2679) TaxID=1081104 RepID=A0A167SB88_CORFA|nr:glycerate dehydrogenase [Cordyceps fumosorosea ARSEF 2679]OAA59446.1 glycerate dehydrogenase [Cordyceps fumosorosea ARSEF 2679]
MVILDDYLSVAPPHFAHINPAEINIDIFKSYVPQSTAEEKRALAEKLRPYSIISAMRERTPFPAQLLRSLPNLKLLLCTGTQFETFDLQAARELGVTVAAAPGKGRTDRPEPAGRPLPADIRKGGGHPTTQHTWALILALARNVAIDDAAVKSGGWQSSLATGLAGKTLGVVGLGRLGAAVARIGALAFGMRVVCWSANLDQDRADQAAAGLGLPVEDELGERTFRAVGKEELFREADVVSMHYVLSERSRGLVNAEMLALMKPNALLVNTSRGPLIDQDALLDAAHQGQIRGIAMDVYDEEPLPERSPWRIEQWGVAGRSKVLTTPHMGYVDEGLMNRWYAETAENLERWLAGKEVLHRLV